MTELQLTGVPVDDRRAFFEAITRHFHEDGDGTDLSIWDDVIPLDRSIVVRDGDRIVGNFASLPVDLSVPGGARIPCAGVTVVGVAQTYKRRGLLSKMMARGFAEARDHEEPVAALYASEAAIYPRFGFGLSAASVRYRIDARRLRFLDPVDVRMVVDATAEEAEASFPAIYEQVRDRRPGVGRSTAQWHQSVAVDPPTWRGGATPRRLVHVPGRGYATYRIEDHADGTLPAGKVTQTVVVAVDREAEQALWQHVCDIDLTVEVVTAHRPVDDRLPWLVDDRLRLRASEHEPLYTRILDVPAALAARTCGVSDGLVLGVHDDRGYAQGTYLWEAGPEGATCTRTDRSPDVELSVSDLSSVWLGGVSPVHLWDSGRVSEARSGAVARLARMVATDRAPWTPFIF